MSEFIVTRENDSDVLCHWGVRGMKWGVRRYQNKDGSLTKAGKKHYDKETAELKAEKKVLKNKARTQKKMDKLKDLKDEVNDLKTADKEAKKGESREEKRQRMLKSTDAKEIYENRSLLTTAELNDRINRIDTEARLKSKIPEQKTGLDWINSKMDKTASTVNSATNMFQKVDTAYSTVSKSAIGKMIEKQLGIEKPAKEFDLEKFWDNRNKKSDQDIQNVRNRVLNEKIIEAEINRRKSEK